MTTEVIGTIRPGREGGYLISVDIPGHPSMSVFEAASSKKLARRAARQIAGELGWEEVFLIGDGRLNTPSIYEIRGKGTT